MNSSAVIDLILSLITRLQAAAVLIRKARDEGREVSEAELDALAAEDEAARDALSDAIDRAKDEGR